MAALLETSADPPKSGMRTATFSSLVDWGEHAVDKLLVVDDDDDGDDAEDDVEGDDDDSCDTDDVVVNGCESEETDGNNGRGGGDVLTAKVVTADNECDRVDDEDNDDDNFSGVVDVVLCCPSIFWSFVLWLKTATSRSSEGEDSLLEGERFKAVSLHP